MKNKKICLIGCGWLGKPLAIELLSLGYELSATTAHNKSAELGALGLNYIQYDLSSGHTAPLPEAVQNADVLIYMIPPLDFPYVTNFFDQISIDKKIIFTSSTSVYGKNLGDVAEDFLLDNNNTNSPLLLMTENYLHQKFKKLTIIRPGGLYGENRHPVFFLQGKKGLTTGNEFLHLVHQQDCINAIVAILKNDIWNEILNLVSDLRISKREYYLEMAKKLNLMPPEYSDQDNKMIQTKISNDKSKKLLSLAYLDPSQFCKSS